ncbi:MAG: transporter substrate-binding protein [Actinomycetia bacterium]|nr:transporter substrate-binding protein [Actinomycetes bacterium]
MPATDHVHRHPPVIEKEDQLNVAGWMRGHRRRGAVVLLAVGLFAGACGGSDGGGGSDASGTKDTSGGSGEPVAGGELTYAVPIESPSMDPCAWDNSGQGTNALRAIAVYDSLVRVNNKTGEFDYAIAESLKPNADFSAWTLKIRDGVKFTDGTAYDAEAVKAHWTRLADPTAKCASAGQVANIESMTATDPLTLEVKLKAPSATFIDTVSSRIGVVPSPTAVKELGADFGAKPVGAGPFKVQSWVKDDRMVLVKNPDYYQADKGLPYLDKVTIRPLLDEDQRASSVENGEADLAFTQIGTTIKKLEDAGVPVEKFFLQGAENLLFNVAKPPFDDIRVRKAFVQSVDTSQLAKVVFAGSIEPADGFLYPGSPYDDPSVQWPKADCDAAKQAWADLAKEKGGPIDLTIGAFNQGQPPSVEFMQAALTKCGGGNVKVKLDIVEAAVAVPKIFARDYQAHGWGIQFVSRPDAILVQLTCDSPRNATGYCNKDFDAALAQANVESDPAKLKSLYSKAETILATDLPVFFYKRSVVSAAHSKKVHGVTIYEDGIIPLEGVWKDK